MISPPEPRPELVVLSHLDWNWVWQRPQQLVSRLASQYDVWFVEEPACEPDLDEPQLRVDDAEPVRCVRLQVPAARSRRGFDDPDAVAYPQAVADFLGPPPPAGRVVWAYTPLALPIADAIEHTTLVYDVMDDLSSFQHASPNLPLRHLALLRAADVVFTGGRSLHSKVTRHRGDGVHCFPSGVECEHYASVRRRRREVDARPVAGYVGVIDERIDLELVETLAALLPDWCIRMVGPVFKIEPGALPTAPNIEYPGKVDYAELPSVLSSFDVALMPFAHNDSTRSISPTKTAEYLAAGLPVVSTAVADVARDFGAFVSLRADGLGFADECRRLLAEPRDRGVELERHLESYDWERIVDRMAQLVVAAGPPRHAAHGVSA